MPPNAAAPLPLVVIGAGAAGTMAALHAGGALRAGGARVPVVLLERTRDGGRKILVSGGGRCNVLPSAVDERRFVTDSSPAALRNILRSWPLAGQVRFFEEELGLPLEREEETGKLFPRSHRARDVRDALLGAARARGVTLRFEVTVEDLVPPSADGGPWIVCLAGGETLGASAVVVATGGLSVPTTGSDGRGLAILRRLGLAVHDTYPALTPLTADPPVHAALAGVSLPVRLVAKGEGKPWVTEGGFLFTHRGYSGPAVLDASHVAIRAARAGTRAELLVQWTPLGEREWEAEFAPRGTLTVGGVLRRHLPERLADRLLADAGVDGGTPLAQLRREGRRGLLERLVRYPLPWTGDEGYRKAEVTGGGVALGEVDARTLECRGHPGLFLCGEVLDAFGPIGGYNFLWAWATGRAAGLGAAARVAAG